MLRWDWILELQNLTMLGRPLLEDGSAESLELRNAAVELIKYYRMPLPVRSKTAEQLKRLSAVMTANRLLRTHIPPELQEQGMLIVTEDSGATANDGDFLALSGCASLLSGLDGCFHAAAAHFELAERNYAVVCRGARYLGYSFGPTPLDLLTVLETNHEVLCRWKICACKMAGQEYDHFEGLSDYYFRIPGIIAY